MAVPPRPRSLWPREHGAYAQLAVPLAAALAGRRPTLAGALLAVAACFAFLVNEPLLVVLGHRGPRRREHDGPRAARRLALTAGCALLAGGAGLALAREAALEVAGIVAVPAAVLIAAAWRRAEHTPLGELGAALALSGAAAPVLAADGVPAAVAVAIWLGWAAGYACTVIAVHRVIARHRRAATARDRAAAAVLIAIVLVAAAIALVGRPAAAIAVPLAAIAAVVTVRPPPATRLREVGTALIVGSLASGAIAAAVAWWAGC